jgi:hypothetical protein
MDESAELSSTGHKTTTIRTRFTRLIALLYVITGVAAVVLFMAVTRQKTQALGRDFAIQQVLRERDRIPFSAKSLSAASWLTHRSCGRGRGTKTMPT